MLMRLMKNSAADRFWSYFLDNEERIWKDRPDISTVVDELKARLVRFCDGLTIELSAEEAGTRELVVSAEGESELFEAAELLVSRAPSLGRWQFIALKPAAGFTFRTDMDGVQFDPARMKFDPLQSSADPDALAIRVYVPSDLLTDNIDYVLRLILVTGLGERAFVDIEYFDVMPMPRDSEVYIPLLDLPSYVQWHLKRHGRTR
jgi:hypothetical protein